MSNKVLVMEGAGNFGRNDVPNCRIRTRVMAANGLAVYIELTGTDRTRWTPEQRWDYIAFVSHIYYERDEKAGYSKEFDGMKGGFFYNVKNIISFVNKACKTNFKTLKVDDKLAVHDTTECFC